MVVPAKRWMIYTLCSDDDGCGFLGVWTSTSLAGRSEAIKDPCGINRAPFSLHSLSLSLSLQNIFSLFFLFDNLHHFFLVRFITWSHSIQLLIWLAYWISHMVSIVPKFLESKWDVMVFGLKSWLLELVASSSPGTTLLEFHTFVTFSLSLSTHNICYDVYKISYRTLTLEISLIHKTFDYDPCALVDDA